MKLNEERVKLLQSGGVVLYTGDKKGSDEVKDILYNIEPNGFWAANHWFYGMGKSYAFTGLSNKELINRPIHPVEWFYEVGPMKAEEYFKKEYGHQHIVNVCEMKDFISLYGLMDEFRQRT